MPSGVSSETASPWREVRTVVPRADEDSVSVRSPVTASYDDADHVTTPSGDVAADWPRSASESPVSRSRLSATEFVSDPANTAVVVTRHHAFDISSYVSSHICEHTFTRRLSSGCVSMSTTGSSSGSTTRAQTWA